MERKAPWGFLSAHMREGTKEGTRITALSNGQIMLETARSGDIVAQLDRLSGSSARIGLLSGK